MLRWSAMGVSDSIDLEAWITTLVALMDVHTRFSETNIASSRVQREAAGQLHLRHYSMFLRWFANFFNFADKRITIVARNRCQTCYSIRIDKGPPV